MRSYNATGNFQIVLFEIPGRVLVVLGGGAYVPQWYRVRNVEVWGDHYYNKITATYQVYYCQVSGNHSVTLSPVTVIYQMETLRLGVMNLPTVARLERWGGWNSKADLLEPDHDAMPTKA